MMMSTLYAAATIVSLAMKITSVKEEVFAAALQVSNLFLKQWGILLVKFHRDCDVKKAVSVSTTQA